MLITKNIRAIIFDVGNTLFGKRKQVIDYYREIITKEKITFNENDLEDGLAKAFEFSSRFYNSFKYGIGDFYALNNYRRNSLYVKEMEIILEVIKYRGNRRKKAKTIVRKYDPDLDFYLFEDVKVMIPELAKNYLLGLCSNWDLKLTINEILNENDYYKYFTFILQSNKIRVGKPNPKIYELVIKNANANPEEILFIGDRLEEDYYGPRKMGMKSLLILRGKEVEDEKIQTIQTLNDIIPYLEKDTSF